jgi:hypothetical protein
MILAKEGPPHEFPRHYLIDFEHLLLYKTESAPWCPEFSERQKP